MKKFIAAMFVAVFVVSLASTVLAGGGQNCNRNDGDLGLGKVHQERVRNSQ